MLLHKSYDLIGIDLKPRKYRRVRKNRFKSKHPRWLYAAILVPTALFLASMRIIVVGIH